MARRAGDADEMRRWWNALLEDVLDRVRGFVATHPSRLDHHERDEATQRALVRFSTNLIDTFEGTSWGELSNATRTLTSFACYDVQRDSIRRRKEIAGSFDDGWDADATDRRSPAWEAKVEGTHERDDRAADARDLVAWALPQLGGNRRAVVELSLHGATTEEICEQLGLEANNVHQIRSRAHKDLRKLMEQDR